LEQPHVSPITSKVAVPKLKFWDRHYNIIIMEESQECHGAVLKFVKMEPIPKRGFTWNLNKKENKYPQGRIKKRKNMILINYPVLSIFRKESAVR
jgi:hypothetical protein